MLIGVRASAPGKPAATLLRNLSFLMGSQAVTWVASLVWTLFVPRTLGPAGTGLLVLAAAISSIVTVVVGLGIRPLLVKDIAVQHDSLRQLISTAAVCRVLIAAPTLAAFALLIWLGHMDAARATCLYLGFAVGMLYLLAEPIQAAFQGLEKMRYLAYSDMLTKTGVSLGAVGLVLLGVDALGVLRASVAVMALVLLMNVFWMLRDFEIDWRVTPARVWSLIVASLPYWSFAVFFTIYLWIDSVMLSVMTSNEVVGWYGMPTKLFGSLMFVPVIVSTAFLPRMSRAFRQGVDQLWRVSRLPMETVMLISMPVCAGAVLVAEPLTHALYGQSFDPSIPVLQVLALCVPPMYLNIIVNQILVASERQALWTKVMLMATILNPALNFLLIRYFQDRLHNGALGAAIALLLTELAIAAIAITVAHRAVTWASISRLLRGALATVAMSAVVLAVRRYGLPVEILAGGITFVVAAAALRAITTDDYRELKALAETKIGMARSAA